MTKAEFRSRVSITESFCWEWKTTGKYRYGSVYVKGKFIKAHRYSWQLFKGPIKNGLWVLHKCDNPACVNPAHLFLGTRSDNMQDCSKKGRLRGVFVKRYSVETDQAVLNLRQQGLSYDKIAGLTGTGYTYVRNTCIKHRSKHVQKSTGCCK